jgi:hypothetical protein
MMLLDNMESEEFYRLVIRFVDREDPYAMSFAALDQATRLQLAEVTTTQAASGNHNWMDETCQLPCRDYGRMPD